MQFVETIRIEKNSIELFEFHLARIYLTAFAHNFYAPLIDESILIGNNPYPEDIVKCRIVYDRERIISVTFEKYIFRSVKSLRLVYDDNISYEYKSTDRDALNAIAATKGNADDVIIIRNGMVTDTSFSNLIFSKNGLLYTPSTYLLNGTRRRFLIENREIMVSDIKAEDITQYDCVMLINGMMKPGDCMINISDIV